jgi:hypothetical protein
MPQYTSTNYKRINKKTISFNNYELAAINHYCAKYNIDNRSKFMRETIITEILKKFDYDYPKLFNTEPVQLKLFL